MLLPSVEVAFAVTVMTHAALFQNRNRSTIFLDSRKTMLCCLPSAARFDGQIDPGGASYDPKDDTQSKHVVLCIRKHQRICPRLQLLHHESGWSRYLHVEQPVYLPIRDLHLHADKQSEMVPSAS